MCKVLAKWFIVKKEMIGIDARLVGGTNTGDSTYWTSLVRTLFRLGLGEDLLLYSNANPAENYPEIPESAWRIITGGSSRWWSMVTFPLAARKAGCRAIHTQYSLSPLAPRGSLTTIHDVSFFIGPEWFRPRDRALLRLGVGAAVRRAGTVLTVSETSKREIESHLPAAKGKVVATPLACPEWIQKQPREPSVQSKTVTVLVQGSNWSRKNQAFSLEVFNRLSEKVQSRLLITGNRSDQAPHAELLGYLQNDAMSGVYARADVLLFPSLHEGFGLPILEGFRTRTLVAASNRGAIPEVAGSGALLFDHFDAARWAAEIQSTLENQSKLQALLDEGESREKSFTWEATARKTREAYDRTR